MGNIRLTRSDFYLKLYGGFPEILYGEIDKIEIQRDGPRIIIGINVGNIPDNIPKNWGEFNRVHMDILLFDFSSINMSKFLRDGSSTIICKSNDLNQEIYISGSCVLSVIFQIAIVNNIYGYKREIG